MPSDTLLTENVDWATAGVFDDPGKVWDGKPTRIEVPTTFQLNGALPGYPVAAEIFNSVLYGLGRNQRNIALAAVSSWRRLDSGTQWHVAGQLGSPLLQVPNIGVLFSLKHVLPLHGDSYKITLAAPGSWRSAAQIGSTFVLAGDGDDACRLTYSSGFTSGYFSDIADGGYHIAATSSHFYMAILEAGTIGRIWRSSNGISWTSFATPTAGFPLTGANALASNSSVLLLTASTRTSMERSISGGPFTQVLTGVSQIRKTFWSESLGLFVQIRGTSWGELWTSPDGQTWTQQLWYSAATRPVDGTSAGVTAFTTVYPTDVAVFGSVLIGTFSATINGAARVWVAVNGGFLTGQSSWTTVLATTGSGGELLTTEKGVLASFLQGSTTKVYASSFL